MATKKKQFNDRRISCLYFGGLGLAYYTTLPKDLPNNKKNISVPKVNRHIAKNIYIALV